MLADRVAEEIATAPVPGMPTDALFNQWAREEPELLWLPSRGMGRLRVVEAPYDEAYFAKYEGYAATQQGRRITEARVDLVRRYTDHHVIDIGIGCGAFIEGRKGWTWGYDINPKGVEWLKLHGRWRDPYDGELHNAISLWDTLEHIPDPSDLLRRIARFVFVSLPIVPGDGPPAADWKHLRRDEHCWYWTHKGFVAWMAGHGFGLREANSDEVRLGREDIGTFAFERNR